MIRRLPTRWSLWSAVYGPDRLTGGYEWWIVTPWFGFHIRNVSQVMWSRELRTGWSFNWGFNPRCFTSGEVIFLKGVSRWDRCRSDDYVFKGTYPRRTA